MRVPLPNAKWQMLKVPRPIGVIAFGILHLAFGIWH
jgi:hypothetical protein